MNPENTTPLMSVGGADCAGLQLARPAQPGDGVCQACLPSDNRSANMPPPTAASGTKALPMAGPPGFSAMSESGT